MFKLKSMPKVKFDTLLQMKESLGLDEQDTVFDYCKRTGDVIYSRWGEASVFSRTKLSYWRTFYDFKKLIGV